jgi:hypothetical protein
VQIKKKHGQMASMDMKKIASHVNFWTHTFDIVLCVCACAFQTTAEALAMNKFVLLPVHPSNNFFDAFPNALFYKTPQEFCHLLLYAQRHDPVPLDDALRHRLSWAAATDRLISAAAQSPESLSEKHKSDAKCYEWHAGVSAGRLGQTLHKSFMGTFSKDDDEAS